MCLPTRQGGPHGQTESGEIEYSPSMLRLLNRVLLQVPINDTPSLVPVRPGAVSPDRVLCLPTFSHFMIVNKTSLYLSLTLPFATTFHLCLTVVILHRQPCSNHWYCKSLRLNSLSESLGCRQLEPHRADSDKGHVAFRSNPPCVLQELFDVVGPLFVTMPPRQMCL